VSRFSNNKFYQDGSAYHPLNINDMNAMSDLHNTNNGPFTLINVIRNVSLYQDTHIASIVISPETKDGKLVEHLVARDGSYTHYKQNFVSSNVQVNGFSIKKPAVTINTSKYQRDTFSSKDAVAAAAVDAGPSQIWIG
jgi:hypothetical protein